MWRVNQEPSQAIEKSVGPTTVVGEAKLTFITINCTMLRLPSLKGRWPIQAIPNRKRPETPARSPFLSLIPDLNAIPIPCVLQLIPNPGTSPVANQTFPSDRGILQ